MKKDDFNMFFHFLLFRHRQNQIKVVSLSHDFIEDYL